MKFFKYIKENWGKMLVSAIIAIIVSMFAYNAGWIVVFGLWVGVFGVCMFVAHNFFPDSSSGNIG